MNVRMLHPADQICMVMKRIYDGDMTSLTGGNLSIMDEDGVIWMSPSSIDKGALTRDDIVQILPDGTVVGRHKPTSEFRIHQGILLGCRNVKAVIHAHAPALTTMSVIHETPDVRLGWPYFSAAERVGLVEYVLPGTQQLADRVVECFQAGNRAAVLKNHAAFLGSEIDLFDAFRRFEDLDYNARVQIQAWTIGNPNPLAPEIYRDLTHRSGIVEEEREPLWYSTCEKQMRRELGSIAARGYRKKLFSGNQGVISARVEDDCFLISGAGKDNAYMEAEDWVRVAAGRYEKGKTPDLTVELHRQVYDKHAEVQSIIVASPVYAMTYAVTDAEFEIALCPESYGVLRSCTRYRYEELFTRLDEITDRLSLDNPFVIIENFGIILAGASPVLAFDKLEVAEYGAQSIHAAIIMDKAIQTMTREQLAELDG